jgi:hypothetical protein
MGMAPIAAINRPRRVRGRLDPKQAIDTAYHTSDNAADHRTDRARIMASNIHPVRDAVWNSLSPRRKWHSKRNSNNASKQNPIFHASSPRHEFRCRLIAANLGNSAAKQRQSQVSASCGKTVTTASGAWCLRGRKVVTPGRTIVRAASAMNAPRDDRPRPSIDRRCAHIYSMPDPCPLSRLPRVD